MLKTFCIHLNESPLPLEVSSKPRAFPEPITETPTALACVVERFSVIGTVTEFDVELDGSYSLFV